MYYQGMSVIDIADNFEMMGIDELSADFKYSKRVFGHKTIHHAHVHLKKDMNNNKMERLNGEIRDCEKVFRDLKRLDM